MIYMLTAMPVQLRWIFFLLLFVFSFIKINFTHASNILIPEVQSIKATSPEKSIKICKDWIILVDSSTSPPSTNSSYAKPYLYCAIELSKKIKTKIGLELKIEKYTKSKSLKKCIILGNPKKNRDLEQECRLNQIDIDGLPYNQNDCRYGESYILDILKEKVIIVAGEPNGIYYGMKTFLQLINDKREIKTGQIEDYPDMKWRGVHLKLRHIIKNRNFSTNYCLTEEDTAEIVSEIERLSNFKINTIFFQSPVFHSIKEKNWNYLQQIFEECRKHYIRPIPTILTRSRGFLYKTTSNKCTPLAESENQEGVWVQKEPFIVDDKGVATPKISTVSPLKNGSFETWSGQTPKNWVVSGGSHLNGWQRISRRSAPNGGLTVKTGNYAITLPQGNSDYFSTSILKPVSDGSDAVLVHPRSYYELIFWAREDSGKQESFKLSVYQYGSNGQKIEAGTEFSRTFRLNHKWDSYNCPIFTHPDCVKLRLEFKPKYRKRRTGAIYLDDINIMRMNGQLVNVLGKSHPDIDIISESEQGRYENGVDYTLQSRPARIDLPDKLGPLQRTQIKITENSSIKKKSTILVSYDRMILNPRGEYSRRCPSSAGTYEYYKKHLKKLALLNPDSILIGLDEYRGGLNRDSRCIKRGLSNSELFASMVTSINKLLHEKNTVEVLPGALIRGIGRPDIRLIIWDDMINYWHNGGQKKGKYYQVQYGGGPGSTYLSLPKTPLRGDKISFVNSPQKAFIPKDVVIACWWYQKDKLGVIKNSPQFYEKRGYDYLVCPWKKDDIIQQWAIAIRGKKALGLIDTTWNGNNRGIPKSASYAWKNK